MVNWQFLCYVFIQIRCPGQDSVPDAESVDRFISEVIFLSAFTCMPSIFCHALHIWKGCICQCDKYLLLFRDFHLQNLYWLQVVQLTSQESQASKYVVVHCTHGHNRTGYMIVHFLVRNQSVSVSEVSNLIYFTPNFLFLRFQNNLENLCLFFRH